MRLQGALPRLGGGYDGWASMLEQDAAVSATKTAAYTATALDDTIPGNTTAGAFNITAPKAADNKGKTLTLIKVDASVNALGWAASSGDSIRGTASTSTQWGTKTIRAITATEWVVIGST